MTRLCPTCARRCIIHFDPGERASRDSPGCAPTAWAEGCEHAEAWTSDELLTWINLALDAAREAAIDAAIHRMLEGEHGGTL